MVVLLPIVAPRPDVVIVEWHNTRTAGGKRFDGRGVDKFRLRDGRIVEKRAYTDTAPLRAVAKGEKVEAIIPLPAHAAPARAPQNP